MMHGIRAGTWLAIGGLALLPAWSAAGAPQSAPALIAQVWRIQDEPAPSPQTAQGASQPQPEVSEEEMRARLSESLGVEVLRVEVVEHETGPAYAVTVMRQSGNRNDAFMVGTLLVDGKTGALLGERSSAPRTAAPNLPTATGKNVPEGEGREIRRRTNR